MRHTLNYVWQTTAMLAVMLTSITLAHGGVPALQVAFKVYSTASATQQLMLQFEQSLTADTLISLAIELDGVDVTAVTEVLDDTTLQVTPFEPLRSGQHTLILYRALPDGAGYEKIDSWLFNIIGSDKFTQLDTLSFNALHEGSINLTDNDWGPDGDSAGDFSALGRIGEFRVGGQVNYMATSRRGSQLTENAIDIGQYTLTTERQFDVGRFRGSFGNQIFDTDRLLVSQLNRRGITVGLTEPEGRADARVFYSRVSDRLGGENLSGLGDADDRLYGGEVSIIPLQGRWGMARVSTAAYSGRGAVSGDVVVSSGDGYSVSADASLLNNRVTVEGGYAKTNYDPDADGNISGMIEGNARHAGVGVILLAPRYTAEGVATPSLNLNLDYLQVGRGFRSLANPFQTADHKDYTLSGQYGYSDINLTAAYTQQITNVEDSPLLPRDQTRRTEVGLNYLPFLDGGMPSDWLSALSIRASVSRNQLRRIDTPDPELWQDIDSLFDELTISFASQTSTLGWELGYSRQSVKDNVYSSANNIDNITDVRMNWNASERLSTDLSFQWLRASPAVLQSRDDLISNVGFNVALLPRRIFNMTRYTNYYSSDSGAYRGGEFFTEFSWATKKYLTLTLKMGMTYGDATPVVEKERDLSALLTVRIHTSIQR